MTQGTVVEENPTVAGQREGHLGHGNIPERLSTIDEMLAVQSNRLSDVTAKLRNTIAHDQPLPEVASEAAAVETPGSVRSWAGSIEERLDWISGQILEIEELTERISGELGPV